ncbi:tonB-dependent receptor family protein [Asticcacaulis biprosthecium C19]|uniref:TonB-dependent receptor family protein n=1 Tax=Asticcacaulis biprosthecium C19 TaxID=715226 RepID=F4QRJ9_9CAUL|nr:TonB-dependent receptor [Asticcacaulis biprosthecium]EGF90125.1 tonB-dependent receptor family protein [Asticcacaulis biprosthecium C19]
MLFSKKGALRLALMAGASFISVGQVYAQDAQVATGEEVVVRGRRPLAESQEAAMKVQKNSDSLVTVLSADAIGDLPDQNVAQAVSRLPGVGIERDQGQGRYVNLRGAPRYWTTLSFDGLSVVSPEGRQTRFDNIPSAIASQVTIQKAIVPSMPGDTVAGNVDIRTRRAFDYKGQKITGKFGLGHVELGDGQELDASLVYSNIFLDGKLGIVAQASYYSREMATENWETDPYATPRAVDTSKRFAVDTKNKHYRLTRENTSASLRFDYKFDTNNTVFASTIYSDYHDDELRDQFIVNLDGQSTNAAGVAYNSDANFTASDPKVGTVYGARLNARITYRDNYDTMATNTLGGEHRFGDALNASWRLNYTWTENRGDNPAEIRFRSGSNFASRPTVNYDFRDTSANFFELFRTTGTTTARVKGDRVMNVEDFTMPLNQISMFEAAEVTKAWTGKVDFDYQTVLFGRETKVEFGGLYTTREKENRDYGFSGSTSGSTLTYSQLAQDGGYLGEQHLGYTFRYSNRDAVLNTIATSRGSTALTENLANYWKVSEDITAAYLMATTEFDWGNIVYGARVEAINNTGEAYTFVGSTNNGLLESKSDETLVYPSVHLNWNLSDRLKARFGLTTSASRADFDDLRPNFTIDDTADSISGGNPDANPEKQVGLDAYLEYYGSNDTFFSAGVFYKDISDVLLSTSTTYGKDDLDVTGFDRTNYTYSTVINGGDGHIQGLELFASTSAESLVESHNLPAWLGGFGVRASATFTESELNLGARTISLSGTSDSVYNVQAIYEKYGLTVRLAAQYRTPWLQDIGSYTTVAGKIVPNGNGDIYWDKDLEVDLSVRYQINDNFEVFADGVNLTNDGAARFGDTDQYPIEYEKFGKRFIAGVRFNF